MSSSQEPQDAAEHGVDVVSQMRSDLIDLSLLLPEDDKELPRLWNVAFNGLVELQHRLEAIRDA